MPQTLQRFESLTVEDLERYSTPRNSLCASIYIPTHRCGPEVQQDPIRLKNAVVEARRQLVKFGLSEKDAERLLKPAGELAAMDASEDFWQHQSDGLAILLCDDEASLFQLSTAFAESVSVSNRFFVKPLIRSANASEEFHLVACSRKDVRVFRGSRNGLVLRESDKLPSGIEEVTSSGQQRGHNRHSFKVRAGSADSSVPHGHVDSSEEADLKQYFRKIGDAVGEDLRAHGGPVVFAGVKELLPFFKEEFEGCTVLDEPASGNADHLSESDLLAKSWPLLERWLNGRRTEQIARFREASGTKFGSTDLNAILPAAFAGRIDTLFLESGVQNYGSCDDHGMVERQDEEASAETSDLYDIAAIRTLRADGQVVFVNDRKQISSPIAAIFRYVV